MNERPLGERVAIVETNVVALHEEVTLRVRPTVHAANNAAQAALLRVETLEKAQQMMNEKVLPGFTDALEEISSRVASIQERVMTRSTDVGWIMRTAGFVLQSLVTPAALLWLGWLISRK